MPTHLHIFDFDGTLCRTPTDTPENRKLYEDATGLPWLITKEMSRELTLKHRHFIPMRRGWFGRPETLEPPLVPDPAPQSMFIQNVCDAFHASKEDSDAITLIMTGRHVGLKNQVLRILGDGKLIVIEKKESKDGKVFFYNADHLVWTFFLGDHGPKPKGNKPTETLPWKIWIVKQFIDFYPEVTHVKFWEDRLEHVKEFEQLDKVLNRKVEVCFVTD